MLTASLFPAIILAHLFQLFLGLMFGYGTTAAMLTVMLLHAGFGCCWHHNHGVGDCEQASFHAEPQLAGYAHDATTTAGEETHPASAPTDGEHHDDCSSDVCRFVRPHLVEVPPVQQAWGNLAGGAGHVALCLSSTEATHWAETRLGRPRHGGAALTVRHLARLCRWRV